MGGSAHSDALAQMASQRRPARPVPALPESSGATAAASSSSPSSSDLAWPDGTQTVTVAWASEVRQFVVCESTTTAYFEKMIRCAFRVPRSHDVFFWMPDERGEEILIPIQLDLLPPDLPLRLITYPDSWDDDGNASSGGAGGDDRAAQGHRRRQSTGSNAGTGQGNAQEAGGSVSAAIGALSLIGDDQDSDEEEQRFVDWENQAYFDSYAALSIHRDMLSDKTRTLAYKKAIEDAAPFIKDRVVLDVGCGTGILSMLCARAGARRVHAVEASDMAKYADLIINANSLESVIQLHNCMVEDLRLDEPVDVIVSEWMGSGLLFEGMFESVILARKRWLKPGGIMLPSHARILLGPINLNKHYEDNVGFWDEDLYGFNYSAVRHFAAVQSYGQGPLRGELALDADAVIADPVVVCEIDASTVRRRDLRRISRKFEFTFPKDATLHGFGLWFDCRFHVPSNADGTDVRNAVTLSTSPDAPPTHWKQVQFVMDPPCPMTVKAGSSITGLYRMYLHHEYRRRYTADLTFQLSEDNQFSHYKCFQF